MPIVFRHLYPHRRSVQRVMLDLTLNRSFLESNLSLESWGVTWKLVLQHLRSSIADIYVYYYYLKSSITLFYLSFYHFATDRSPRFFGNARQTPQAATSAGTRTEQEIHGPGLPAGRGAAARSCQEGVHRTW